MPDYALLAAHLSARTEALVTLAFAEVEVIINGPLPLAAWTLGGWWTGPGRPAHGAPWAAAGWRVAAADPHAGTVTFARDDAVDDG
jgi:hypothetical protein